MCLSFNVLTAGQSISETPVKPSTEVQHAPKEAVTASHEDAIKSQAQSIAMQQQSVERQRATIQQQLGGIPTPRITSVRALDAEWSGGWAVAEAGNSSAAASYQPGCPPVPPMFLQSVVQRAATAYNVAPNLINAVIRQESGGYPCAVSEKGAMGLMQLMPATAAGLGASEPFDVDQNVSAGTRLLAELIQRYKGDMNRVLGAYNAGTVAVDRAGGAPPFAETQSYIHSVLEQIKAPFAPKLFAYPGR